MNDKPIQPNLIRDYHDIYVDVDGTLADSSWRQHFLQTKPKNWKAFYAEQINDPPHRDIIWLVQTLKKAGNRIIICSGRPEDHKTVTEAWLKKNDVPYDAIYMRQKNDFRDDNIIKVELVQQMWADGYDPTIALDDRNRVVDALRNIGMRVLHVQPGDF